MFSKVIVFAAAIAASQCGYLGNEFLGQTAYPQPLVRSEVSHQPIVTRVSQVPVVAPVTKTLVQPGVAEYDFGHTVSDPYTNNHQDRKESRRGDVVQGSYSLLDADGTKRIVDYIATPATGFRAVIRKEPVAVAPLPVAPLPVAPLPVAPIAPIAPVAPFAPESLPVGPFVPEHLPIVDVARRAPYLGYGY